MKRFIIKAAIWCIMIFVRLMAIPISILIFIGRIAADGLHNLVEFTEDLEDYYEE